MGASKEMFIEWLELHEEGELELAFARKYSLDFSRFCADRVGSQRELAIFFAEDNENYFQLFLDEMFVDYVSSKGDHDYEMKKEMMLFEETQ